MRKTSFPPAAEDRRFDPRRDLGYDLNGGLVNTSNTQSYKDSTRNSELPGSTHLLSQDDILMKLRFTEEQLNQERRSRSWLESELQNGKSTVSQLTAKLESLAETSRVESIVIRDLQRQIESCNRNSRDGSQELAAKFERDQLKMHQMVADVAARQMHAEKSTEEAELRHRSQIEEVNNLRYRLESFALKASEATTEVRAAGMIYLDD
jgi:hypothetical protein